MIPCLDHLEIEAMIHAKPDSEHLTAPTFYGTLEVGKAHEEESGNGKVKAPAGTTAPALP